MLIVETMTFADMGFSSLKQQPYVIVFVFAIRYLY